MAYSKRTPPIKVIIAIELFNILLEVLSIKEKLVDYEMIESTKRLKEKLLRYSRPFKENGTEKIEVQFFINEANEIIYHLLSSLTNIEAKFNYYEVLLKVRRANSKV